MRHNTQMKLTFEGNHDIKPGALIELFSQWERLATALEKSIAPKENQYLIWSFVGTLRNTLYGSVEFGEMRKNSINQSTFTSPTNARSEVLTQLAIHGNFTVLTDGFCVAHTNAPLSLEQKLEEIMDDFKHQMK